MMHGQANIKGKISLHSALLRLPVLDCEYYSKQLADRTETLHYTHQTNPPPNTTLIQNTEIDKNKPQE